MKLEEFLGRVDAITSLMCELRNKGHQDLSQEMVSAIMELTAEEIEDMFEV